MEPTVRIFICYAKADNKQPEEWLTTLRTVLDPVASSLGFTLFADQHLESGAVWDDHLKAEVMRATDGILLVSPKFTNSDYIRRFELPVLLTKWAQGKTRLWPLLIRHTPLDAIEFRYPDPATGPHSIHLSDLQFSNDPAEPLSGLSSTELDKCLSELARRIAGSKRADQPAGNPHPTNREDAREVAADSDTPDLPVYAWNYDRKVALIRTYPIGPAISLTEVSQEVIDAICESLTAQQFVDLSVQINRLRRDADPELSPRQILIPNGALPNPDLGLENYAHRLLANVFVRGPRMIVAFLASLPATIWSSHGDQLAGLMSKLQSAR